MAQHHLQTPEGTLEYALVRSARKTIGFEIRPDGALIVRAPLRLALKHIEDALRQRAAWIHKHQTRLRQKPAPESLMPSTLSDGATLRYLGEPLTLRLRQTPREQVIQEGHELVLCLRDPHDERCAKRVLEAWLKGQAQQVFAERLALCFPLIAPYGVAFPALKVRLARSRWGSCSNKGGVMLNRKLIHLPVALIDYVIVHELCHLVHFNHSRAFYTLMSALMPDWLARRTALHHEQT